MKEKADPCTRGGDSYESHARNLHSRARSAYADWTKGLSPKERQQLRSARLDAPPDDNHEVGGHSPYSISDIADTPLARIDPDFAAAIDRPEEILAEIFNIPLETAKKILQWHTQQLTAAIRSAEAQHLQIIVGGLLSANNPKLSSAGLAFAANLAALNGLPSQREYAKLNHISPEAISKMVRAWSAALGLMPSVHQKSPQARQAYSEVGRTRHWRGRKVNAAELLKKRLASKTPDPNLN